MINKLILLVLLVSVTGFSIEKHFKTLSATDFYESMSLYQEYAQKHNVIRLYSLGLALSGLGYSQGAGETIAMGLGYFGQGLLQQFDILANPYAEELSRYRTASAGFKSREDADVWTKAALRNMLEQEQQTQWLDGAVMAGNGVLFLTSGKPSSAGVGVLMLLLGAYLGLCEKGALAKTVEDYGFFQGPQPLVRLDQLFTAK
jgi:hypothetical protein